MNKHQATQITFTKTLKTERMTFRAGGSYWVDQATADKYTAEGVAVNPEVKRPTGFFENRPRKAQVK